MKLNNWTIVIVAVSLVLILGLVTLLEAMGKDSGDLIYLILTIPSVLGVGQLVQTSRVAKQVEAVEHKVNGRMTQLIEKATANGHDVSEYDDVPRADPPA